MTLPVFVLVMAVTLLGCDEKNTLSHFGWQKISPVFDSLTVEAERGLYVNFDSAALAENLRRMDAEAATIRGDKGRDARARVQFWTANFKAVTGSFDEVMAALDSASALNDPQRFPYTAHRIANQRQLFEPHRDMTALEYNLKELDYYRRRGEVAQQGNMAMMIGNGLYFFEAPEPALKYYRIADSLFRIAALEGRRRCVRLNQMSLLAAAGDTCGGGGNRLTIRG